MADYPTQIGPNEPYPQREVDLLGPIELVTRSSNEVISSTEAKDWCRITGTNDQSLLDQLIVDATAICEQSISGHRQFMTATYDLPVACWWCQPLRMPRPPLQSITSITYYDSGGTLQTLSSSVYVVRTPWRQQGTVELAPLQSWPAHQTTRSYPIIIRFVAGYGTAEQVPSTIKRAVAIVVNDLYTNRSAGCGSMERAQALLDLEGWGSYS